MAPRKQNITTANAAVAASSLLRPMIDEVLEAFKILQNDSLALDYCGIDGGDRALILADPYYSVESKKIKAKKFAEEVSEIDTISSRLRAIGKTGDTGDDNSRIGVSSDPKVEKEMIVMQMKAAAMRRDLLNLSSVGESSGEETEALNIYFIPVTREEFERLSTIEIHYGNPDSKLTDAATSDAPASIRKTTELAQRKSSGEKGAVIPELKGEVMEYTNDQGEKIIEEV